MIALLCFTATVFSGCGNRTEAVITDGEDITTVSAEYPTLEESHADIFTYKDLKIGNISYLMTESQVIAILGKPKEETENDGEKIYSYNEMSIGFEKLDDNNRPSGSGVYKVTQAASIGSDDKFSRNMRVGQSADDILKMYYRDADYQNHLYMSEDKTLTYGKLLYGDFTIAELDKVNTKETVAYGLVNYNGYNHWKCVHKDELSGRRFFCFYFRRRENTEGIDNYQFQEIVTAFSQELDEITGFHAESVFVSYGEYETVNGEKNGMIRTFYDGGNLSEILQVICENCCVLCESGSRSDSCIRDKPSNWC